MSSQTMLPWLSLAIYDVHKLGLKLVKLTPWKLIVENVVNYQHT